MAPIAERIAGMVEMLPEAEQTLAYELVKRMVLAWDPDFTRLTPAEQAQVEQAEAEIMAGEYVSDTPDLWQ